MCFENALYTYAYKVYIIVYHRVWTAHVRAAVLVDGIVAYKLLALYIFSPCLWCECCWEIITKTHFNTRNMFYLICGAWLCILCYKSLLRCVFEYIIECRTRYYRFQGRSGNFRTEEALFDVFFTTIYLACWTLSQYVQVKVKVNNLKSRIIARLRSIECIKLSAWLYCM